MATQVIAPTTAPTITFTNNCVERPLCCRHFIALLLMKCYDVGTLLTFVSVLMPKLITICGRPQQVLSAHRPLS